MPQVQQRSCVRRSVSMFVNDPHEFTFCLDAARDGRVEVVHDLVRMIPAFRFAFSVKQVMRSQLMNGARPDYRDVNHRSSIQYALKHPQVLWLCESALRRCRASDSAVSFPSAPPYPGHTLTVPDSARVVLVHGLGPDLVNDSISNRMRLCVTRASP